MQKQIKKEGIKAMHDLTADDAEEVEKGKEEKKEEEKKNEKKRQKNNKRENIQV